MHDPCQLCEGARLERPVRIVRVLLLSFESGALRDENVLRLMFIRLSN